MITLSKRGFVDTRKAVLEFMPHADILLSKIDEMTEKSAGNAKALRAAESRLTLAHKRLTAAIENKLDDEAIDKAEDRLIQAEQNLMDAQQKANKDGTGDLKEYVDILLGTHFDDIVAVLSGVCDVPASDIEKLSNGEVLDLIGDLLKDRLIMSFFPRAARLALKIQSGTSQKSETPHSEDSPTT